MQADDDAGLRSMAPLNVSERLENPPVNPITVPGVRLASIVSVEVRCFQDQMRRLAARNTRRLWCQSLPIFQSDCLLLRLEHSTGSVLTLHRAVHGIFMQDAVKQSVTFTTAEALP
eukprot:6211451-Pleurochrysis_carterae.AAC.2